MASTNLARLAATSVWRFGRMALSGGLHLRGGRLWQEFSARDGGSYSVFRETVSDGDTGGREVVLVFGFRLRALGSNASLHAMFRRACILTTPFWCGFEGFRVKLWMTDLQTKSYLGIYRWQGKDAGLVYADALTTVLRVVSTRDSVWFDVVEDEFERFLAERLALPVDR